MSSSNELGSSLWGAVKISYEFVKSIGKSLFQIETDPTAKGLMQLTFVIFAPLLILGAVVITVIWFLLKKAYYALKG